MKEAAGEANMTVITIVLIGVVAAVGLLLVPRLMDKMQARACCTDAGWIVSGTQCIHPEGYDKGHNTLRKDWMQSNALFSACLGGD